MRILTLMLFINSCFSGYWEKYIHPSHENTYNTLSLNLNKDVRENFMTLNMAKYEFREINEKMKNMTIKTNSRLLEKKMTNRRKMDRLFARHSVMIKNNHRISRKNIDYLEKIRLETSNSLYDLKKNHEKTKSRLENNDILIKKKYNDKYNVHYDTIERKYKKWKNNHEEAADIINGL
jgi:hypothetical protein